MKTKMTKEQRREYTTRAGHVGCEVWEQSGVGTKGGLGWHVTNAAVNKAVEITYFDGIEDEAWITKALGVYKDSWPTK